MSKILITGNGFDLFHGLPTKYGHFMQIMNVIENIKEKEEYLFYDLFNEDFGLDFHEDNERIHQLYDISNMKFDKVKVLYLKRNLENNLLYKYFKTFMQLSTWIDFEIEIKKLLSDFDIFFDYIEQNNKGNNRYRYSIRNYFQKFEIFNITKKLNENVFMISEDFLLKHLLKPDEEKILKIISESLEDFIVLFNLYLSYIVDEFFSVHMTKNLVDLKSIDKVYTFNYTHTLQKLYSFDKNNIAHLHGMTDKLNPNIVLGVDEIVDNLKKYKLFEFTKYYQKIKKSANVKFIDLPNPESIDYEQNIFYFIGHSLDESDKEYILDIFNFLKFEKNKLSKICIFYYNENDKIMKLKNLFKVINKEVLIDLNKSGRLYFIELNEQNIQKEFSQNLLNNLTYV